MTVTMMMGQALEIPNLSSSSCLTADRTGRFVWDVSRLELSRPRSRTSDRPHQCAPHDAALEVMVAVRHSVGLLMISMGMKSLYKHRLGFGRA